MKKHGFGMSLLALCFLVWSGLALDCEWDQTVDPNQTLDLFSVGKGAQVLGDADVSDTEGCQAACCARSDCELAWISYPASGKLQCHLVSCTRQGQDGCDLQSSSEYKTYRKKVPNQNRPKAEDPGNQPRIVPLMGSWEPRANETNDIRCRRPMKVGSCRAAFPRFYYDVTNQVCRSFIFGGCEGNGNNFDSQEECEAACSGITGSVLLDDLTPPSPKAPRMAPSFDSNLSEEVENPKPEPAVAKSVHNKETDKMSEDNYAERCEVESKAGPCRAAFQRWYYNSKTGSCETFIYGGCRGNRNNYVSEESCKSACTGVLEHHDKVRSHWTAAFFLFVTLAAISALLLVALVLVSLRRHRWSRPSSVSDKEELLPDEQCSVESLTLPESPKPNKA
ncbi:kunitz-type protease inhibitor 2 [Mastacembelus armatus]|uniref:Serine peptidase inhibitor, Kunitz type, 2 n=1 Tax=Mastacembelus armatus TaxID=205130 RepID=A0A3Q3N4C9_9TELE|nr:kunitz-type protease inhibitor 2-like [Mastacembelus armatus]